jgi:hypothetical protein
MIICVAMLCVLAVTRSIAEPATTDTPVGPVRYTFSWPLNDPNAPAPRGGTTRGAPVTLDREPSAAWRALQEPGLSAFERDRRAILAMAGEFRVSFDFLEIETFQPGAARDRPYQSWGTERVCVDRDEGAFISLVHILEMRVLQDDGSIGEPMVTKHWRQDWQYEPAEILEYRGRERWERRAIARVEREARWSQTVHQVDESPRYASLGRWEHSASFSTWLSADTWRPLPRREWSVRKDYQVLIGTNRHTVTATGWVQEENNLKAVLTEDRSVDASLPFLAREYGVARYARLSDADFAAADQYYQRTREFWNAVHGAWNDRIRDRPPISLRAPIDQAGLFRKLFEYAEELAADKTPTVPADEIIGESLKEMGAR